MIKVFFSDEYGKVSFTKEEIENLLKEAKDEGYSEGYNAGFSAGKTTTPSIGYRGFQGDQSTAKEWWMDPSVTTTYLSNETPRTIKYTPHMEN